MKIKNKKTGALISVPEHLQEDVKKIIAMGGDPMTILQAENIPLAKDGIKIKPSKVGSLRKHLGVKEGEKIPASKLKIKDSDSEAIRKKKQFAINAKSWAKEHGGYLPMAQDGDNWNMYSTGFDPTISQYTPLQNLQPLNIDIPQYQLNERKWATPIAPTGMENKTEVKDLQPFGNQKPKFNLKKAPTVNAITGNKYLNRGLTYMNQAIKHGMNINNPNPDMSPDYSGISGFQYAQDGLMINPSNDMHYDWSTSNTFNTIPSDDIYYAPTQNTQQFVGDDTKVAGGGQNKFNNIMQGVAAGVNATQGLINFGKGALDIIGSQNQNRQAQQFENQLYTQSVYADAMNTKPQDYIYNRNALRETGGKITDVDQLKAPRNEANLEIEKKNGIGEFVFFPNKKLGGNLSTGKPHSLGGTPIDTTKMMGEGGVISSHLINPETDQPYAKDAQKFSTEKTLKLKDKIAKKRKYDPIFNDTMEQTLTQLTEAQKSIYNKQEKDIWNGIHGLEPIKSRIEQNQDPKLMAKYGGKLTKAQTGWQGETYSTTQGRITPTGVDLNQNPLLNWENYRQQWEKIAEESGQLKKGERFKKPADLQEFAYDWALDNNPDLIKDVYKTYGITNKNEKGFQKYQDKLSKGEDLSIDDLKTLRGNYIDNYKGKRMFAPKLKSQTVSQPQLPTIPKEIEKIVYKDRIIKDAPQYNLDGLNINIPLPNVYSRLPLNYYKINPEYIDPRYLNVQDELNDITRNQRSFQTNIGSRSASDISNLLQAQANADAQRNRVYSQKYNYDRQQDAQAQQFNAQAKMNTNQYNQQSWYNQLEAPLRMREAAIGDQELTDYYRGLERIDQANAYRNTKDYIDKTYGNYKNLTKEQLLDILSTNNPYSDYMDKDVTTKTTTKKGDTTVTETKKGKYGAKVKIKPKIKRK